MGDILGIEITQTLLYEYFSSQKISFRLNDGDRRIVPRINEINQEYRAYFRPLKGGIIYRKEFDECIEAVKNEKGIIISGSAGYGKSGCTEAILAYCEEKKIPHIAIKLDRRIPHKNCEIWGKELGFPSSIVHSIHCVSKNENAVRGSEIGIYTHEKNRQGNSAQLITNISFLFNGKKNFDGRKKFNSGVTVDL